MVDDAVPDSVTSHLVSVCTVQRVVYTRQDACWCVLNRLIVNILSLFVCVVYDQGIWRDGEHDIQLPN